MQGCETFWWRAICATALKRLEQEHLECTCFVSKHTHKFTFVFDVFTEKERICVLMAITLLKFPFISKLQTVCYFKVDIFTQSYDGIFKGV